MQYTDYEVVGVDNLSKYATIYNLQPTVKSKRFNFYVANAQDADILEKICRIERPDFLIDVSDIAATTETIRSVAQKHNISKAIRLISFYDQPPPLDDEFFITLKTCKLYGPRQHPQEFIPSTISQVVYNNELDTKTLSNISYDWMYVREVFDIICILLSTAKSGQSFVALSGFTASHFDIYAKILSLCTSCELNKEVNIIVDFPLIEGDIDVRLLGWNPSTNLEESLEHTICWYYNNKWALEQE